MNETATSAEAGQLEASGGSAIPPCSADPAHVEAVAIAVPSIAASLLQEVAEVGKRPISAETVEQVVAGPEEKMGDENFDESVTPTEAQHETAAEVPGGSRLPSCEMATELAQILGIEELARLQGIEHHAPQEQPSQQDVGHDAGGHSDSEVPEPPRAPPEEDDGTSPLKLSLKATPPVGRPLGFRRGMEKVSVKAPPRVAKPPLGKAKGAPSQPVPLAPQTPPPPLPPPPPKGAVPKAQQKPVQIQEKAALPETSAADVSAATVSAATAPAPVAAKAQPKQVQLVAEKAAPAETPAATASAAPAPVAAKAQPKQVQFQVAEKALPETAAADVSAATVSSATAPVAAKAQPKQVQFQVGERAAPTETPAATAPGAPAPAAAKAQPRQVQFQVAEEALPETAAADVSAATVSPATAPVAAKAQPRQVQFQVAEEAAPHPPTAACAQAPPAAPTAPASSLAPLVDSITRSSPSPAKAQAVHNIGAKAAPRVILKGSDGQFEGAKQEVAANTSQETSSTGSRSREIVVRQRNMEKLGQLQCHGGPKLAALTAWRESSIQSLPKSWAFTLPESGLEPKAVSQWLQGEISWGLCHVRMVDALQRKGSTQRGWNMSNVSEDVRKLPIVTAEDLNSQARQALVDQLVLNTKPWLLGTIAGGLVSLPGLEERELTDFLPPPPIATTEAVESAFHWFCCGLPNQEQSSLLLGGHQSLVLAISYRRLQLKAHPITTSFCSAGRMLEAAVKLETLSAAASRDSLVGDEKQTAKRSELTDVELLKLMELMRTVVSGEHRCSHFRTLLEEAGFLEENAKERMMRYMLSLDKLRNDSRMLYEKTNLEAQRIILGLSAMPQTFEEVQKAYRIRAKAVHPDRHGDKADEYKEKFQELQDAYERICRHVAGGLPPETKAASRKIQNMKQVLPAKFPRDLASLADHALYSAQTALMLRQLTNPVDSRPPGRPTSEPTAWGPERDPLPSNSPKAERKVVRKTKRKHAVKGEESAERENHENSESEYSEEMEEGEGSESGASGEALESESTLTRGPWRSGSYKGRSGLMLHYAGAVMEAAVNAHNLGCKIVPWVDKAKPFFLSFIGHFSDGRMAGSMYSDLTMQQTTVLDQLEAGFSWSSVAIDLGIHSKIEASNCSDNSCHWEPRSKTGRTEGQDAAAEAGVAALSVTSSIMACHEAYQEAQRFSKNFQRAMQTTEKKPCPEKEVSAGLDEAQVHKYAEKAEKRKDYIYAAALIWDYNRDMLWNQALLRQCVENYPFIVEPVTQPEKEAVFSVVIEVLEGISKRVEVLPANEESLPDIEVAFSAIFIATAWHFIASPSSLEARLLRLAALIDVASLKTILEEFFANNLNALGERGLPVTVQADLSKRWEDARKNLEAFQIPSGRVVPLAEWPEKGDWLDSSEGEMEADLDCDFELESEAESSPIIREVSEKMQD